MLHFTLSAVFSVLAGRLFYVQFRTKSLPVWLASVAIGVVIHTAAMFHTVIAVPDTMIYDPATQTIREVFTETTELWTWDPRLENGKLVDYGARQFEVRGFVPDRYGFDITFFASGTPEQALRFMPKYESNWASEELIAWGSLVLQRFVEENQERIAMLPCPLWHKDEAETFRELFEKWWQQPEFSQEGIGYRREVPIHFGTCRSK